ncbi:Uncharacterised protein [Helicobacter mustelae]|nr:Uncharacterised protein [Helicobacter mustelae]
MLRGLGISIYGTHIDVAIFHGGVTLEGYSGAMAPALGRDVAIEFVAIIDCDLFIGFRIIINIPLSSSGVCKGGQKSRERKCHKSLLNLGKNHMKKSLGKNREFWAQIVKNSITLKRHFANHSRFQQEN